MDATCETPIVDQYREEAELMASNLTRAKPPHRRKHFRAWKLARMSRSEKLGRLG